MWDMKGWSRAEKVGHEGVEEWGSEGVEWGRVGNPGR